VIDDHNATPLAIFGGFFNIPAAASLPIGPIFVFRISDYLHQKTVPLSSPVSCSGVVGGILKISERGENS